MAQNLERKKYLDAAKGLGINMIVFGHISFLSNPVNLYFGSFKLALFFIVSGYLLFLNQSVQKYTFSTFFRRHFKSLMLPYAGYSLLILLYGLALDVYKYKTTAQMLGRIRSQLYRFITLRGYSTMWFLPCLFLAQLLFFLVCRLPLWARICSFFAPLFVDIWFHNVLKTLKKSLDEFTFKLVSFPTLTVSKAILAFWFIYAGWLCCGFLKKILRVSRNDEKKGLKIQFLIGIILSVLTIYLSTKIRSVDINNMNLGKHPLLLHLAGITGSVGAILILETLEHFLPLTYLSFCGRHSLTIMATHGTFGFKRFCMNGWKEMYGLAKTVGPHFYMDTIGILLHLMLMECGIIAFGKHSSDWFHSMMKKTWFRRGRVE